MPIHHEMLRACRQLMAFMWTLCLQCGQFLYLGSLHHYNAFGRMIKCPFPTILRLFHVWLLSVLI